ncbi:MAG: winged helix-turn-helix transcriptional regulator [Parcubacteria group bacterium]|nr:winged helix-turn-helix transcriptional regulator [Parcubacteria group bacterium]
MSEHNKDMSYTNAHTSDTKSNTVEKQSVSGDALLSELKRTERISAGLYMVTNSISDTEPVKAILREKSISLLSDMSPLRDISTTDRTMRLRRAEDTVLGIITLLHVAYAGDLISEMNMRLLKEEYLVLRSALEKGVAVSGLTERALAALFEDDHVANDAHTYGILEKRSNAYEEKARHIKGHIKDTRYAVSDKENMSDRVRYVGGHEEEAVHGKRIGVSKNEGDISNKIKMKEKSPVDILAIKDKRRKQIMSVIKKRGRVGIKDITSAITDTSEKTLQRALATLVKEGVVKKEGEKRWSVYSVK